MQKTSEARLPWIYKNTWGANPFATELAETQGLDEKSNCFLCVGGGNLGNGFLSSTILRSAERDYPRGREQLLAESIIERTLTVRHGSAIISRD